MKWKEFFASTLPRSRKSRKKSSSSSSKSGRSSEQSGSLSSPETDDIIIRNQKVSSDVINGNRHNIAQPAAGSVPIAYNRLLVSADFQYYTENNNTGQCATLPPGHQYLAKTPSNASESGFEDGHEHYCNGYCDISDYTYAPVAPPAEQPDIITHSFNTFPKERTRIKTNPWLSSFSANSMTSSVTSESAQSWTNHDTPSPVTTPEYSLVSPYIHSDSNLNGNNNTSHTRRDRKSDSCGEGVTSDASNSDLSLGAECSPVDVYNPVFGASESGVVEGGNLVINLKTGNVFVKPQTVASPVSFLYEDDMEATLERDSSKDKKAKRRSRDNSQIFASIEPPSWDDQTEVPAYGDIYREAENDSEKADSDRDGTLTRRQTRDWPYESRERDTMLESLEELDAQEYVYTPYKYVTAEAQQQPDISTEPDECCNEFFLYDSAEAAEYSLEGGVHDVSIRQYSADVATREYPDSAYDSSTTSSLAGSSFHGQLSSLEGQDQQSRYYSYRSATMYTRSKHSPLNPPVETQRSLEEIRTSLKDKVDRLKAEKRIVDAKVKQAREEEEIRREERARIHQEMSSLRKQVLLQTLQDLKINLEDQSHRLQEAYDDVMDMQWLNTKLRRLRNTTL